MHRPRIWQWPNLLALDAAIVAVAWQASFATALAVDLSPAAVLVLALSVWLTYMADRLFDADSRPMHQLLSARHRFAKTYSRALWRIWWIVLILDVGLAFSGLTGVQLRNGGVLLTLCLAYTWFSQKRTRLFFPKEICVAVIFAGGAVVFIGPPFAWGTVLAFALVCLLSCLLIGKRESSVDAALGTRSLAQSFNHSGLSAVFLSTLFFLGVAPIALRGPIALTLAATGLVYVKVGHSSDGAENGQSLERFRVSMEAVLLVGPLVFWLS